jgi:transposase
MTDLKQKRRLVAVGVASATEMQQAYDAAIRRRDAQYGAPEVTVEALVIELRERGDAALKDSHNRQRLAELSTKQVDAVIERLAAKRAQLPLVTDELLVLINKARPS